MGREVRMVPKNWQHPKKDGQYIGLFDGGFADAAADWDSEKAKWDAGEYPDYATEESKLMSYSEWAGGRPDANDYMPDFPADQCTHCMMYETTTEGTPISPAFETPEELARWLFDNGASAFGYQTASYESWLRVARGGYAPSAIYTERTGVVSGVEGMCEEENYAQK